MKKILIIFCLSLILISSCSELKINKCKKIQEKYSKDGCYLNLSIYSKDKYLCTEIENRNVAINCVLSIDKNEKSL